MTSDGNNFNDFPENQFTIDFASLCKPTWSNATVSPSPLSWYHLGKSVPQKYFGKRRSPALPLDYTTGYARLITCKLSDIAIHTLTHRESVSSYTLRRRWMHWRVGISNAFYTMSPALLVT